MYSVGTGGLLSPPCGYELSRYCDGDEAHYVTYLCTDYFAFVVV